MKRLAAYYTTRKGAGCVKVWTPESVEAFESWLKNLRCECRVWPDGANREKDYPIAEVTRLTADQRSELRTRRQWGYWYDQHEVGANP